MKKNILLLVFILSAICNPFYKVHALEEKGWVSQADLPEPRSHAATAAVGDKIYVIGGYGQKSMATNTTFVYDSKKNEWSQNADMPINLAGSAVAVVKEKIYILGGNIKSSSSYEDSSKVFIYDTKTDTWEQGIDAPTKNFLGTAVAIDETIYLMTQQEKTSAARFFSYNTSSKKWVNKANQPANRRAATAAVVDGKIYYIGGGTNSGSNSIYEYDPSKDSWVNKANLNYALWYTSSTASNGKIYIIGGFASSSTTNLPKIVQVYDPASDSVSVMDEKIQFARGGAGTVSINGDLYTVGGGTKTYTQGNAFNSIEKYSIKDVTTPDPGTDNGNGTKPDDEVPSEDGDALLIITMVNGLQKEYQLSMKEVNAFLKWYKQRDAGEGPGFYEIDEHDNNKGPFESKKDYVVFKNILMYEVNKYKK
ncbi:Kelch repeat-containing protein [Bacillus sp. NPDC077027]|uniref:Kelch repeat-containing protein n=1 Tax=Bacillus sp. NPDC077027 TaxID=3390548 RepID=UPI003D00371D